MTDNDASAPEPPSVPPNPSLTDAVRLVVGAAIVDDLARPARLLAARRTEPPALAGGWELPGGKVEPGESPLSALHREVAEELGVSISVGALLPGPLPGATWPLSDRFEMIVWIAEVTAGVPAPIEDHDQLRWLPLDELESVRWLPADGPVVRALGVRLRAGE
ncbi:(deoxy)nucleoside triphosphate pyrophosphohydrolase [Humibacillus sp. DSM 29435]|uniref:(deoxy)nucleoside triphosphate pyrophosphohydrolase n=1 Tax=Humibacillus sp. DSM 29435 TaxID=1869167 RepID=UPI0009F47410|nr:(deoxy)nucleoside triphosphate pyrophosphohydrolase [Humibacillus sp. DSM 29435]